MHKLIAGLCVAAALAFCLPSLTALLIFDRPAIAAGEWWRLASCSLVHLSPTHLLLNLLAMAITMSWARHCDYRAGLLLFLLVSIASSLFIWEALPDMQYFGGLSGIATALFVYTNLQALRSRTQRWLHVIIIGAVVAKTLSELLFDLTLANTLTAQPFKPVPAVHVIGVVGAFIVYGLEQLFRWRGVAPVHLMSRNEAP